jgi:hypothetical protein
VDEKSWLHFLEFIYILVQRYIKNVFWATIIK